MNLWQIFVDKTATLIGKINWTTSRTMRPHQFNILRQKLKDHYYIIVTRHNGHLSSYAISLAHFFLTGKKGYYGHVFMNLEDQALQDSEYRFIEALGSGVKYSDFNEAFDSQTSSVALLKPKALSLDEWNEVLEKAKEQAGKPYDTLFDLADDKALSCVELVRTALMHEPNYATDFANFERMIAKDKNLDPQMFYECEDFEVVWESRH